MASNIRTVIEITDTHIKLLQVRFGRGKLAVTDYQACPVDGKTDDELRSIIHNMIQARAIAPEQFIVVLPRRLTSIRRLRVPSLEEGEIRQMLPLQIGQILPYSPEDVVYGYDILEKEKAGYSRLLTYIVHKDVSEKYSRLFDNASAMPTKYVPSSLGVAEWYRTRRSASGNGPVLILNLDLMHTEACFVHKDQLLFSRVINFGVTSLSPESLAALTEQVELTVKLYRKEGFGDDIVNILLVATLPVGKEIIEALTNKLSMPVVSCAPIENIVGVEIEGTDRLQTNPGLSMTVCLGLACADPNRLVNLIAKQAHDLSTVGTRRRQIWRFSLAGGLFLAAFIAFGGADLFSGLAIQQRLKAQSLTLEGSASEAREKVRLLDSVDAYLAKRFLFSNIITKLYQLIPPDITLRSMNIDRTGNMVLGGYAQSGSAVNLFQSRLVSTADFSDVTLQFTAKRKLYNQDMVEFKIQFKLKQAS